MIRVAISQLNREALESRYEKTRQFYEGQLETTFSRLSELLSHAELKTAIKKRMKSFDSFFAKVLRKAKDLNCDKNGSRGVLITDLLGIRVVCPFLEDTLRVEEIVRRNFEVVERERKGEDYSPREFGYESTHLIVKIAGSQVVDGIVQEEILCEIQIRSILQDAWAEVEHELMYKAEFTPFDEPLRRKLAAVNANLSLSDIIFQEIRDYQRQLQTELKKRRKTFLQKLQSESEELQETKTAPVETSSAGVLSDSAAKVPDTIDNLLLEALTEHNLKEYAGAISIYSLILARNPKKSLRAVIHIHRGMAYFGESRYAEALEDFDSAVRLDPTNPRAYYYRGVVQRFRKNLQDALADFDRCIELDAYQFDPLFSRAQVYFGLGDYVRAHEDCVQALAIKPKVPEAQRFFAVVTRRLQFSKRYFETVLQTWSKLSGKSGFSSVMMGTFFSRISRT